MKARIALLSLLVLLCTLFAHGTALSQIDPIVSSTPVTFTVEAMVDGPDRTASEIYAEIAPAIAYVKTPSSTGSGVLIEHGYLLTNAHVVHPYDQVRVVFPDGSEFPDMPVVAWDMFADLALVGPFDTAIEPLALVDGSDVEIGRNVYLIGYPLEPDPFPQPSITSGILSRIRSWDALDLSLFQSDATIAGGQSGGVLVTYQGDVIGISTIGWDGFAMSTSVHDALPRLDAMLAQDVDVTLTERRVNFGDASTLQEGVLRNDWDERTYILNAPAGSEVELYANGLGLPYFTVVDQSGYPVAESNFKGETGATASFTIFDDFLHYVQVSQYADSEESFSLSSSHPLIAYNDPDDGKTLRRGQTVIAGLDTPLDYDYYEVYLHANELIEINVDSIAADTLLRLDILAPDREETLYDGFSGGGVFDDNDKIVYRAPTSGAHKLTVEYLGDSPSPGGYYLSLSAADRTAQPTVPSWSRQFVDTPAGQMTRYESEDSDLEILYPSDLTAAQEEDCLAENATLCAEGYDVGLTVTERDLTSLPQRDSELSQYVDYLLAYHAFDAPGFELISRQPITTLQGLMGETFLFSTDTGLATGSGVVFMDEANGVAFDATYVASNEQLEWLDPLIAESFASFRSWAGVDRQADPIHHLDQGNRYLTGENGFAARTAFTKAIQLNPELTPAYAQRAYIHYLFEDLDSLHVDMDKAISLAPDDTALYLAKADMLYRLYQYRDAKPAMDDAIKIDGLDPALYTQRAKVQAMLGDYDRALSDLNGASTLAEGSLTWDAWETLAFVHLRMGDFAEAAMDYNDLLDYADWPSPHALMGAGIAHAELSENDIALDLLTDGMQAAYDLGAVRDPQLEILYEMAEEAHNELSE